METLDNPVCLMCRLAPALVTAEAIFVEYQSRPHCRKGPDFERLCLAYPALSAELRKLKARRDQERPSGNPIIQWPRGSRYRTLREIARGGMGIVYEVEDRELLRHVAMKVIGLPLDGGEPAPMESIPPAWVDRFIGEAQITARLDHPNIVPVYDIGFDPAGRVYFTMKLIRGFDFQEVLGFAQTDPRVWNLPRVVTLFADVCEAVGYAHERGIIHRDLKPRNIVIGERGEAYVMDWGLSKAVGQTDLHDLRVWMCDAHHEKNTSSPMWDNGEVRLKESPLVTMDGRICGTPAYMSPEHAGGLVEKMGPASDVYSLSAVLYELIAGRPPYWRADGSMTAKKMVVAIREGPPASIERCALGSDCPQLVSICNRGMEREWNARYSNASELAKAVKEWLKSEEARIVRNKG